MPPSRLGGCARLCFSNTIPQPCTFWFQVFSFPQITIRRLAKNCSESSCAERGERLPKDAIWVFAVEDKV